MLAWFKARLSESGKAFLETKQISDVQERQQALMAWWETSGGLGNSGGGRHSSIVCHKCGW